MFLIQEVSPARQNHKIQIISGFPGIVSHQAHFALTNVATGDLNPTKCGEMLWVDGCCLRGAKVVWYAQLNAPREPTNEISFRIFLMNHQEGASSLGATQWLSMQYAKMPANYMSRSLKQLLATPVWCMNHEIRMFWNKDCLVPLIFSSSCLWLASGSCMFLSCRVIFKTYVSSQWSHKVLIKLPCHH